METVDLPNGNFSFKIRARTNDNLDNQVSSGEKLGATAETRRLSGDAVAKNPENPYA
jgi:hypothetical protein